MTVSGNLRWGRLYESANLFLLGDIPASLDWTTVELACAIVCACLPTYGPLLQIHKRIANVRTSYGKMRNGVRRESETSSFGDSAKLVHSREEILTEHSQIEV